MGCDWYNFISVSGVGFRVTEEQYLIYKDLMGPDYTGLIFSEGDECKVITYIFICDKETGTYNQIEVPGPYTIDLSDHCTTYTEQKQMVQFFHDKINTMKMRFDLQEGVCSYWSILTTMGVGEFELSVCPDEKYKTNVFPSVEKYREYHGYDDDEWRKR